MKLLVYNIPNTLNYGSMMMAENLFYYLTQEPSGEKLELIIITPKPEETTTRLKKALQKIDKKISIDTISSYNIFRGSGIKKLFSLATGFGVKNVLSSEIADVDGVVVLGGDDFSEDYGYLGAIQQLIFFNRFNQAGKYVILCGQTIGPFYSWRKPIFKYLFKNMTQIISRDPITFKYLTDEFELKNVSLGADLAFLPLARENDDEHNIFIDKSYFTVVPSGLIWRYAKERDRFKYITFLAEACLYLYDKFPDSILLILPHVVRPDVNDDSLAGRDLYIMLKRLGVKDSQMLFIQDQLLPYQARRLLKDSQFVFTGRMHAAISSFACGVPALSLSYSRKYWGIIGEYLGLKDLIIDIREIGWVKAKELSEQRIDYIINNSEVIKAQIDIKVPEMREKALASIRDVKSLLSR